MKTRNEGLMSARPQSLTFGEKVIVIGAITRDVILRHGKTTHCDLGGMLYNAITLAVLSPNTLVIPISNVGYDAFDEVISLLENYRNVELSGLRRVQQKNIKCTLLLSGEYGIQWDEGEVVPITYSQVKRFIEGSFVLVTFPTGFDLRLNTLRRITEMAKEVYLDYHILTKGRDELGVRYLKRRRNWQEWVKNADFVQFNRFEAGYVSGHLLPSIDDIKLFGKSILRWRVRGVVVTCGKDGSFFTHGNTRHPKCLNVLSEPVKKVLNTIGCGCVYAAGFVAEYLRSHDIETSLRFASRAAALRCTVPNLQALSRALRPLTDNVKIS